MTTDLVKTELSPMLEELKKWFVEGGEHPQCDGWYLKFVFPNQLKVTVIYTTTSNGIEIGVRNLVGLFEVIEDVDPRNVIDILLEIMQRGAIHGKSGS